MRNTNKIRGSFDVKELPTQLLSDQNTTNEPVRENQIGITAAAHMFVTLVAPDTVAAGSLINVVSLTSANALVGDIISFTSGALAGTQVKIKSINGLLATVVNDLSSIPLAGVTVDILRYTYPLTGATGIDVNVTNNPLNVNVVNSSSSANINTFNEISSVPSAVLSTILTYTVPAASNFFFSLAEVAGDNIANYTVLIDGVLQARKYTYFGGALNADFDFKGFQLTAGQVIQIKVIQNRPSTGTFSARVIGSLI